jgi:tRNA threonylcarbamoyladenosine biosynthesis protein TsaE
VSPLVSRDSRPDPERSACVWTSRSVEETEAAGARLAPALEAGDVIALTGPLGAGKTRVVAGLARGLGWRADVRSPTFTLVNEYHARVTLVHADLYRVEPEDVEGLGLPEYLEQAALAVEWGEKLPPELLADALTLEMAPAGGDARRIAARAEGAAGTRLLAAWIRACGDAAEPQSRGGPQGRAAPA